MYQPALTVAAAEAYPLIDFDLTGLVQLGIFAVMALIATRLLFRPYVKMREDREAGIEGARVEAGRWSGEADTMLSDYRSKLAAARARAYKEQQAVRGQAAAHEREVTEKARADAQATVEDARARIGEQARAARDEMLPRAEELAEQIVGKLLARKAAS
jgi:F-type H+-transporting ATPase subunit b